LDNFQGSVVHTQFWPQDLDYANKRIVVIGSGATAITLVPALAHKAALVTMLQRSPSYIMTVPREDAIEKFIYAVFPKFMVHRIIRFKWLLVPWLMINFFHYFPKTAIKLIRSETKSQLPPTIQHDPHFQPSYNPFEQRMCFCPDGDFYQSLRNGTANVVTGQIADMTADTIKLTDGQELHPDIIVTATGLKVHVGGGIKVTVDGKSFHWADKFMWKNAMLQDLPNVFYVVGYVDYSWTLGADSTSQLACRMIQKMEKDQATVVVPRVDESKRMKELPLLRLSSTYVQRAKGVLPKAGDSPQWRPRVNYFWDILHAWYGDIASGLQYIKSSPKT